MEAYKMTNSTMTNTTQDVTWLPGGVDWSIQALMAGRDVMEPARWRRGVLGVERSDRQIPAPFSSFRRRAEVINETCRVTARADPHAVY